MRILVTGGFGFQGSHLCERLAPSHEVTAFGPISDRSRDIFEEFLEPYGVRPFWSSLRDPDSVNRAVANADYVYHLGGLIHVEQSFNSPREFIDTNVMGTVNVLEACRVHGVKAAIVSSCEVYGGDYSTMAPKSPYAASKLAMDRMSYAYHQSYGVDLCIIRPSNIYGPRQRWGVHGAFIPRAIYAALKGSPITIYGTGEQSRDYLFVSDLIDAYVRCPGVGDGKVLNISAGQSYSINTIAQHIIDLVGGGHITHVTGRPGEVEGFNAKPSGPEGWAPSVSIRDGIIATEAYIRPRVT